MVTGEIPDWWVWAYWVSPLTYAFNSLAVNEMFAPRWMHPQVNSRSFLIGKMKMHITQKKLVGF